MRLGHGVPPMPAMHPDVATLAHPHRPEHHHQMMPKKPCGGAGRFRVAAAKFNEKAVEVANTFRKAFGLPLIEAAHNPNTHHHHQKGPIQIQVVPTHGNGGSSTVVKMDKGMNGGWWGHTKGGDRVQIVTTGPAGGHMHHHNHGGAMKIAVAQPAAFYDRLMGAIMSLGPWEGRAVAFVIGAGIGVLIRMFWVLGVVMFRGMSKKEDEYEAVNDDSDDEDDLVGHRRTPISAPPSYVYPVDEKIVYAQEVDKAPAPADN